MLSVQVRMANIPGSFHSDDSYLPLDNSAIFTATVTRRASPFIYRLSCELDEPVHLPDLEAALEAVSARFPFFNTVLRHGVFWFYLDPIKKPLRVLADTKYPVEYHRLASMNRHLFRVRAYGSRISCEFHHILTDGTGAMEFLKSLVAAYLSRRGVSCPDWGTVRHPEDPPLPGEMDDAYADLVGSGVPLPDRLPRAWHLPGPRFRGLAYRVTTGTMSVSAALEKSRAAGVSLTAFLTALHLAALQDVLEERPPRTLRPICVQIPVNMRNFHKTDTLRNFFLVVPVSIDPRLGHYGFDEILARVNHTLKLNLTEKELSRQIRRNVRGEELFLSRIVPLVIKNAVVKIIGLAESDGASSGSLSNLQSVALPAEFARHVRRIDFLPPRSAPFGACIGVVSFGDALSVTVGSLVADTAFERHFFSRCAALGIPVTVESNM
jgi:hypothetical protein